MLTGSGSEGKVKVEGMKVRNAAGEMKNGVMRIILFSNLLFCLIYDLILFQ